MIAMLPTLRIGPIELDFPVVQAALSGYSDWAMRVVARRLGAPYTLCEVMLDRFVKKFPAIQPSSKAPQGKSTHVGLSDLKWIDSNTAEVNGGFSNGMDGRHSLYRIVRRQGEWVVEKSEIKAIS